jgi:hypothetical protein
MQVALRFREIIKHTLAFGRLASFVDCNIPTIALADDFELWTEIEKGADSPHQAAYLIGHVVHGALVSLDPADRPTEQQLYELTHRKRRQALGITTVNMSDLMTEPAKLIPVYSTNYSEHKPTSVTVDQDTGEPQIDIPVSGRSLRGIASIHSGTTLGCPGIRVKSEDSSDSSDSSALNLVDYIMAGMIDEARRRGLFDLSRYDIEDNWAPPLEASNQ